MDPVTLVIVSMAVLIFAMIVMGANFTVMWDRMEMSTLGLIVHMAAGGVAGISLIGVLAGIAWTLLACYM